MSNYSEFERLMSERLGVQIQVVRVENINEVAVSARYSTQKTVTAHESDADNMADAIFNAAIAAKLALCSHVQEQLTNIEDKNESREIVSAAYRYRLKLSELQFKQECYSKMPRESQTLARKELIDMRNEAVALRNKLLDLAALNYKETITL